MSVYQDFWDKLKNIIETDVPLGNFLNGRIIFGTRDKAITKFPTLVIDPIGTDEGHIAHPRKKNAQISFRFAFKIHNTDGNLEIKQSFEAVEVFGNALDKDINADYGGLLLHIPIISTPSMDKIGDNVRDVIIETTFEILPIFFFGGR